MSSNIKTSNDISKEKEFASKIKKSYIYEHMDRNNKKALDVMTKEGSCAAINHMFTNQENGTQLSYSEMRMRYG